MYAKVATVIAGLFAVALAQTDGSTASTDAPTSGAQTTAAIFLPWDSDSGDVEWAGRLVGICSSRSLTTYALACTSGEYLGFFDTSYTTCDSDDDKLTVTQGVSTLMYSTMASISGAQAELAFACDITSSSAASCSYTLSASTDGTKAATTTNARITGTEATVFQVPISATASPLGSSCPSGAGNIQSVPIMLIVGMVGVGSFVAMILL